MRKTDGKTLACSGEQDKNTDFSLDNQATSFLQEHKDILSHAMFHKACDIFNQHIQKHVNLSNKIYEEDCTEEDELFRIAKLLDQNINECNGYMELSKHIFEVLAHKCFSALNLDATKFEEYKQLRLDCDNFQKHIIILKTRIAFLEQHCIGLEEQNEQWLQLYKLLSKRIYYGQQTK